MKLILSNIFNYKDMKIKKGAEAPLFDLKHNLT